MFEQHVLPPTVAGWVQKTASPSQVQQIEKIFSTLSQIETAKKKQQLLRKHFFPRPGRSGVGAANCPRFFLTELAAGGANSFTFLFAFLPKRFGEDMEDAAVPVGDEVRPRLHPQHRLDVSKHSRRQAWSDCGDSFGRYRATVHMGTSGQLGFRWSKGWWFDVMGCGSSLRAPTLDQPTLILFTTDMTCQVIRRKRQRRWIESWSVTLLQTYCSLCLFFFVDLRGNMECLLRILIIFLQCCSVLLCSW